jgi:DNA-binding PadR family transcriptional regulator
VSGDIRPDRPAALTVGLLRPCILAHLIGGQSVYGYELHHWLLGIGVECDLGTVYRSLNTMEADGLLHSTWERTSGGRSRRRYELNDAGLDMSDAYVAPVQQLLAVAQEFLAMHKAGAGRPAADRASAQAGGSAQAVSPLTAANAPLSIPARRG